ncbi:MAG: hypothetical protein LBV74_06955 [Tannerella sp.]|nr:hypothetical protein [Tannerella sp.]
MKKHPINTITLDNRYTIVLKQIYLYFADIRKNTPENAVILYPEYNSFFPANKKSIYHNDGIAKKIWAIRFLHPRILIQPSELAASPYKDKITHVAIINGQGYKYLPYKLKNEPSSGIFPVRLTDKDMQSINYEILIPE